MLMKLARDEYIVADDLAFHVDFPLLDYLPLFLGYLVSLCGRYINLLV